MALISVGISDGNKLKCAPKFSKMPPFSFYLSVIPSEITDGHLPPTIPSVIVHLTGVLFGMCDFHR
jgi:hypothetical protein